MVHGTNFKDSASFKSLSPRHGLNIRPLTDLLIDGSSFCTLLFFKREARDFFFSCRFWLLLPLGR